MTGLHFFPQTASTMAPKVDAIFFALIAASTLVTVGLIAVMVYFGFRYHHSSPVDRSRRKAPVKKLELAWTAIPFVIFMGIFVWAASVYYQIYAYPADAVEVQVLGKMWMWKLKHPGGQAEIDQLHIAVGTPVKLLMTSEDVIHSFYVPAFRTKQDVIPGRYTTEWFTATKPGTYKLFCAEFCGTHHSRMIGQVVAMQPADYQAWLSGQKETVSVANQGEALFRRFGCSGCHGANSTVRAPDLTGLYGRPVPLAGDGTIVADETYIRDSILTPNKQVAAGYAPIMPSFKGQISEEEIMAIIAYLKSGRETRP